MSSKYDDYWAGQLPRIHAQMRVAAGGLPASVGVPGLTRLGERHSWYGVAVVRMREMAHGSGAHATSLGKTVAASGICAQWPEREFRFTIDARGDALSITAAGTAGKPSGNAPGRIFMSYRRDETAYPAAWLFDRLAGRFGRDQVFKDVDSIEPGDDFAEVITTAVESCDVLLALIGRRWLTIAYPDGRRRLDDPGDFVRLEIEAALARDVRVIPVLVDGARMPGAEDLPPSLVKLTRRQALELSPAGFDSDTQRLLRTLERIVAEAPGQAGRETDRVTAAAVRMATAGTRGQHLDAWALQADGTMRHWWWPRKDGTRNWSAPETFRALPAGAGPVADIAAGSRGPGHAEVLAADRRGSLWHRRWSQDDGWAGWQLLTSDVAGPVAACSLKDGHIGVFAADPDQQKVQYSFSRAAGTWSPWTALTGLSVPGTAALARLAAVGVRGQHMDAWALRTDGTITHARWPRKAGDQAWSEQEDFTTPPRTVDIATASRGPGHAEVFAIDQYGSLWHRWWLPAEGWAPWQKFTDHVTGPVAACSHTDGHVQVFVTDPDSNVIKYSSSSVPGNWEPWRILG